VDDFDIKACPERVKDVINRSNGTEEANSDLGCNNVSGFIAAHSSLLLTHCLLVTMERFSAGYLSRGVKVKRPECSILKMACVLGSKQKGEKTSQQDQAKLHRFGSGYRS